MTRRPPFDHLLLVQRHPVELARWRAMVARQGQHLGSLLEVAVVHEVDDSCCRREPWPITLVLLLSQSEQEQGATP